jgi:hypothetical protein
MLPPCWIADSGKRAFRVTIRAAGNDPDGIVLRQRVAGGDCGGFQHAVIEYARNVLGWQDAGHAETDSEGRMVI